MHTENTKLTTLLIEALIRGVALLPETMATDKVGVGLIHAFFREDEIRAAYPEEDSVPLRDLISLAIEKNRAHPPRVTRF